MDQISNFHGYWMGYQPNGNTLDETPSAVGRVTLFVAGPMPDNTVDVRYLCKEYSQAQQIAWVKTLQARGVEVLVSFMDNDTTPWTKVDPHAFAANVKATMIDGEWGLNGVDVDLESNMPSDVWASTFIGLIRALRSALGPLGTVNEQGMNCSRLSAVGYVPPYEQPVLEATGAELDWFHTMNYGQSTSDFEAMFRTYRQWIPQVNMGIGVYYDDAGDCTDLGDVAALARFANQTNGCGMMQFSLNNDCESYTKHPQWTWASAIADNMTS